MIYIKCLMYWNCRLRGKFKGRSMQDAKHKVSLVVTRTSGLQEEPQKFCLLDLSAIKIHWITSKRNSCLEITRFRILETKSSFSMSYSWKLTQASREIYLISYNSNSKWNCSKWQQKWISKILLTSIRVYNK